LDDGPTPDEYYLWNETELKEKLIKADKYREHIKGDARECLKELVLTEINE